MRNRLPITKIGTVEPRADGNGIDANNWSFGAPYLPHGTDVPIAEGHLGGWNAVELHSIAHGVPCDCPIGRDHQARSPLD